MATNCLNCKWRRISDEMNRLTGSDRAKTQSRLGVSEADIRNACLTCAAEFKARLLARKKSGACLDCAWKDRNLPFEARRNHCQACVEAFVMMTDHDCTTCVWNNAARRQPSDATLAHCKACLAIADKGASAMNCDTCSWRGMPEVTRRPHCMSCSMRFAKNSKVRGATNELSNKGQTIISYDNHNSEMTDDRDTVSQVAGDYKTAMASGSKPGMQHPVFNVADRVGMTIEQFAEEAYEKMKRFLYEFSQLTDLQALLFLSEVKGEKKTDFAKNHNITDSMVNTLAKQLLVRSQVFHDFIVLSRGTTEGTRGRKAKDGKAKDRVPKKTKKIVYAGVFQPVLSI